MIAPPPGSSKAPAGRWRRLHLALMPDYSHKATVYWWVVVCLGVTAVLGSAVSLAGEPTPVIVQVVAGVIVAMLAGFFPVRVP